MITIERIRELCSQYGYTDVRDKFPQVIDEEYVFGDTSVFRIVNETEVCYWETQYMLGKRYQIEDLDEPTVIKMIENNLHNAVVHEKAKKEYKISRELRRIKEDFV